MIIHDYLKLQEKYVKQYGEQTLVLMQVGSFHEAYSTNERGYALDQISQLLNIQKTKKNKNIPEISESNPYLLGFPSLALKKFIKILINDGLTVVIYNQRETG